MNEKMLEHQDPKLTAAIDGGVEKFLASSSGQPTPGNDHVAIKWNVTWEQGRLTTSGNVRGRTASDVIHMVVTAFVSPDYNPHREPTGRYYAGNLSAVSEGPMPGGLMWGFILQSQQFTAEDHGTTIKVAVGGWVNQEIFGFEQLIVIPNH
jgi:hypothetical protein